MDGERFRRAEWVFGLEGMKKLSHSQVAVFGIGGVGGYAVEALARSGVGSLVLVDHDCVSLTNINRQIIALDSTLGQPKVQVMASRIREINPACEVIAYQEFYQADRAGHLLHGTYDYVVDAIDTVGAKVDLLARCHGGHVPIVSAMGAGNKVDPTRFVVADIGQTHTCPLARVIRCELRQRGIERGIKTVFSTEPPVALQFQNQQGCGAESEGGHRRAVPGSTAFVPPVAGFLLAGVVVRDIVDG